MKRYEEVFDFYIRKSSVYEQLENKVKRVPEIDFEINSRFDSKEEAEDYLRDKKNKAVIFKDNDKKMWLVTFEGDY